MTKTEQFLFLIFLTLLCIMIQGMFILFTLERIAAWQG